MSGRPKKLKSFTPKSALTESEVVKNTSSTIQKRVSAKSKNAVLRAEDYIDGIRAGNRTILSQAITLIESSHANHFDLAQKVIEECMPYSGNSLRIGITGVPGVGKSTFIDAFGIGMIERGHKIAVLAIDPSSSISKGSILGDKTRMEALSSNENAFIRPSPSSGSLGGVARKTRETIILCEAAGFDRILVETVGVGQSEFSINSMIDFFLLLMLAGAGDELQGIKRGITEMCDGLVITKADGDNILKAEMAKIQYQNALHLFQPHASGCMPWVETASAVTNRGIGKILDLIAEYEATIKNNGYYEKRRSEQQNQSMFDAIHQQLYAAFYKSATIDSLLADVTRLLEDKKLTPYQAAQKLIDAYFKSLDGANNQSPTR